MNESRIWLKGSAQEEAIDIESIVSLKEILHYAYARLGNREDAEDVAMEVIGDAHRIARKLARVREPRLYVFGIARKKIADAARARSRKRQVGAPTPPEDNLRRQAIAHALDLLPEPQREALVLKYLHGFTQREIAELMGKSPEAVNSLLQRARETFGKHAEGLIS